MKLLAAPPVLALALSACGPDMVADVSGKVDGFNLSEPGTVMFGGPFIVILDKQKDCMDLYWITRYYAQGEAPADFDFKALQFTYEDPEVQTGQYSVAGEAAVSAKFLVQSDMAFTEYRARDGNLVVEELSGEAASGSFDVTFSEGELSGSFDAVYCRNLKDN